MPQALSSDVTPLLSLAGIWQPVSDGYFSSSYKGLLANTFAGVLPLGVSKLEGLVVTGWAYNPGSATVVPVNVGILDQNADGTLSLDTSKYVTNPQTNGGGSVVIADFNFDGQPDIFLAAHNETPFVAEPSTVLLSNPQGTFTKTVLTDAVMAHDANLAYQNGKPIVITDTFVPGDVGPIYAWNGSGFTETQTSVFAMSAAAADFASDGNIEIVYGEAVTGPNWPTPYSPDFPGTFVMYHLQNDGTLAGNPIFLGVTPYFNNNPAYTDYVSGIGSAKPTHTYRVWTDDFNHDGKPDIIAAESIWPSPTVSMLQLLQNEGNLQFKDVTHQFNPDYRVNTSEIDYNMQMVDLDHSGINSYLSAGSTFNDRSQSAFLLMNDGTGRLHVALQDQFTAWGQQATNYILSQIPGAVVTLAKDGLPIVPKFIGYQSSNGLLNFEAQIQFFDSANGSYRYGFVNVPTQLDVDALITTPITITDRNGSHLIRTFAGDDTIYSNKNGGSSHVDGGLGFNTLIYSGSSQNYSRTLNSDKSITVHDNVGRDGTDTLVNIQVLQFKDKDIFVETSDNANIARLYSAAFGRAPDPAGLEFWQSVYVNNVSSAAKSAGYYVALAQTDDGSGMSIAAGFMRSSEFFTKYGSLSDAAFATQLYQNVLGRAPDQAGLNFWVNQLEAGGQTRATVLVGFAESPENIAKTSADWLITL